MRPCKKCGVPFDTRFCVPCKRARDRVYCKRNAEKARIRVKEWAIANPERAKATSAAWYARNRDRIIAERAAKPKRPRVSPEQIKARKREALKRYKQRHREKILADNRAYAKKRQPLVRAQRCLNQSKYKARKKAASGAGITLEQWSEICGAFGNACAYCFKALPLEMDHFIALSRGGAHDASNIVPACKSCNSQKRNSTVFFWLPRMLKNEAL